MEKLPEEIKRPWVNALRSGEYKQGINKLYDGMGGYCCIGVFGKVNNIPISDDGCDFLDSSGNSCGYQHLSRLIKGEDVNILWEMNDGTRDIRQRSFSEIADYIEANL